MTEAGWPAAIVMITLRLAGESDVIMTIGRVRGRPRQAAPHGGPAQDGPAQDGA